MFGRLALGSNVKCNNSAETELADVPSKRDQSIRYQITLLNITHRLDINSLG